MMKNKLLIKLYVPAIDSEYEIFIPTNETIKKVVGLIIKCIEDLSDITLSSDSTYYLIDPELSVIYPNSAIIRDTNIVNDKKIILL